MQMRGNVSGAGRFPEALYSKVALPVLGMSGLALHLFTVWTAFRLSEPGAAQYVSALAAYVAPPASEFVVAYFAWRETGSKINGYSIWFVLWVLLLLAVTVPPRFAARRRRNRQVLHDRSSAD